MDQRKELSLTKASLTASIVAAFGASICCIGPVVAAFLGLTSFGALVKYEKFRPLFSVITFILLAGAFYLTYRNRTVSDCEPGSVCATHPASLSRINRIMLWVVTAIVLIVMTFPTWSNWILG